MTDASAFSPDYAAARARFLAAAHAAGWDVESHPVDPSSAADEELTLAIDVARIGPERPEKVVVISSGLHGVEGFFGSAVQAALLEEEFTGWQPPKGVAVVLAHALNPFGFAHLRRVNENNVDLNRNFLLDGESFTGSPARYAALDPLLNPRSPPPAFELFLPRAAWNIARYGLPALKDAVAGGQYDVPKGLFYGGDAPQKTQEILRDNLGRWLGTAAHRVFHVDLHTGLGARGTYKLLVDQATGSPAAEALIRHFGPEVQPWAPSGVSYAIRGGLGTWCKAHFPKIEYDVLVAEFGTVAILGIIGALRAENRAHHWGAPGDPSVEAARRALKDAFAPPDVAWRSEVVAKGVAIAHRALVAVGA
jgi:hypothetical protein